MIRLKDQMKPSASCRGLCRPCNDDVLTRPHADTLAVLAFGFYPGSRFLPFRLASSRLSFSASFSFGSRSGNGPSEHLSPALGIPRASKHLRSWPSSPAGLALRVSARFKAFAFSRATKGRDGRGLNYKKGHNPMKTYQHFATVLTQLLGNETAVRITVDGYMPLSIEHIGQSAENNRLIAISHTGIQNADLMRDPEMVFEVHAATSAAEPLSFQNDYIGLFQEVYRLDDMGKKTHVNTKLKAELKSFARLWFRNLKDQGFLSPTAKREKLA